MNRNLVLLGICLLAVSFVGEAFGQKKNLVSVLPVYR